MDDIVKNLKRDGLFLKYVSKQEQTKYMCAIAVKQNPNALQYASKSCIDSSLCMYAVKKNAEVFRYVPEHLVTEKMCERAVEADAEMLNNVPAKYRTNKICLCAVKQNITVLSYLHEEKRKELFADNAPIDLIERVIKHNNYWLKYMPLRNDVVELCIKCMKKDFSIAQYFPEHIKTDIKILKYQKSVKKLKITDKYYNGEKNVFCVECEVICENYIGGCYHVLKEFVSFDEFYKFLSGKLKDADLRSYDFARVNLKKYNVEGAIICNRILNNYGLYDSSYFDEVKSLVNENEQRDDLEDTTEFYSPDHLQEDDEQCNDSHILFFYISDIHLEYRIKYHFKDMATKEEIACYIKDLAKQTVDSVGVVPINSYLLIAGDTSCKIELSKIFYNELLRLWHPKRIIVISGNHELRSPWVDMNENISVYRKFFESIGIVYLQNDIFYITKEKKGVLIKEKDILSCTKEALQEKLQFSPVVILGGIGFSGLNDTYNATMVPYGKSFSDLSPKAALEKDIEESNRFNCLYQKLLESVPENRVIILTHSKKANWNDGNHNSKWIYVNGHDHRNYFEINKNRTIYADNQIGYSHNKVGLKYFYCDAEYDIFAYYENGIYKITREQYIEFNRGKLISMSLTKTDGDIYMLKYNNQYMFIMHCFYSKRSNRKYLYLMNGGKLKKLGRNKLEDLYYYYCNLELYTKNVEILLEKYTQGQRMISDFIKHLGGSGKIHGCIIDVEKPKEFEDYSYCHIFVNPMDGKITPYFAYDVKSRIVYKDFKTMLENQSCCKLVLNNYLLIERDSSSNIPTVQYSKEVAHWGDMKYLVDEGSYIYKISKIIKSLQYCVNQGVVRLWEEKLLDYNLVEKVRTATNVEAITDDRLLIDTNE